MGATEVFLVVSVLLLLVVGLAYRLQDYIAARTDEVKAQTEMMDVQIEKERARK